MTERSSQLLGYPPEARVLIINADDFGMYPSINSAVVQSIENGIASSCSVMPPCPGARQALQLLQERRHIPFGIHLTLVCDFSAYRWKPFDLGLALAEEYQLAARVWLDRGRRVAGTRSLPVVDHDFLDSFSLDVNGKADRYLQLLRDLPPGLTEWAVHPGPDDPASRKIDDGWKVRRADLDFLISSEAWEAVRQEHVVIINYGRTRELWSRQWASGAQR